MPTVLNGSKGSETFTTVRFYPEAVIVEVKRMAGEGKFLDKTIDGDLRREASTVKTHRKPAV